LPADAAKPSGTGRQAHPAARFLPVAHRPQAVPESRRRRAAHVSDQRRAHKQ